MSTLAVDIGGGSIKTLALNDQGVAVTETLSQPTPVPAEPEVVFTLIRDMADTLPPHRRVSVGFPGVVKNGVAQNAPNLGDELWQGTHINERLTHLLQRPVRAVNDADLQGLGVARGKGVELVLTLGTGLGAALFTGGALVPNLEFGHHPLREGQTYEDLVRDSELKLALQLIEQSISETFDPSKYSDEVRGRLKEVIDQKIEGQEVTLAPAEAPQAQVIDLMEALKASLSEAPAAPEKAKKASGGRKAAKSSPRKAATRKTTRKRASS